MNKIISRKRANELGLERYFTGKPCINGHIAERSTRYRSCIECKRDSYNEWAGKNKDKHKARMEAYHEKNKDREKEYRRNRYLATKKNQLAQNKAWREKNKDKNRERLKRWRANNPDASRIYNARRRSLLSKKDYNALYIDELKKMQKNKCSNCGESILKEYHIDHIIPISLGGQDSKDNIELLCPNCNMSKHAKDPIDWANENGRLL